MRVIAMAFAVSCAFVWAAPSDARAQSLIPSAGLAGGCRGSDGSVCDRSASTASGTVAWQITEPFSVAFRVSRFEDDGAGETSYFSGPRASEVARVRHEWGRTVTYGVEFLYRPPSLRVGTASGFVGGGVGVRTARVDTTCVLGDCTPGGLYSDLIREARSAHDYLSFVAGVDVGIAYGFLVRGVLRVDNFPSETGTAQLGVELGYVFRLR